MSSLPIRPPLIVHHMAALDELPAASGPTDRPLGSPKTASPEGPGASPDALVRGPSPLAGAFAPGSGEAAAAKGIATDLLGTQGREAPAQQLRSPAGSQAAAPQNSLEAIAACLDAGAAVVEVDITALAGDDYLLVHEPLLEAETNGSGPVAQCTAAQARGLSISRHGIDTPYRVALLSDVVGLLLDRPGETHLQLDFKNVEPFADDEPLQRLLGLIEPLGRRVLVSTGADWQLRKLHRIAPWLMLGFDVMGYLDWEPAGAARNPDEYPKQRGVYGYYDDHPLAGTRRWPVADYLRDRCESLMGLVPAVSIFYIRHTLLAQSLNDGFNWAEALHSRGIRLDAWTLDVTDPLAVTNALRLLASGVDQFTTNTPRALAGLLNGSPAS